MSKTDNCKKEVGHVEKCGGIPMYPAEYHFDMEKPEDLSEEVIHDRKKRLNKFLEKYGL